MYYCCPNCSSKKKPKMVNYFPPITVKCLDCDYMNFETKFVKEEQHPKVPLNYTH